MPLRFDAHDESQTSTSPSGHGLLPPRLTGTLEKAAAF